MNDFKKEDLQDIANALENYVPDHVCLRDKIQSMIDNYCEHEWVVETKEFDTSKAKCHKCGVAPNTRGI